MYRAPYAEALQFRCILCTKMKWKALTPQSESSPASETSPVVSCPSFSSSLCFLWTKGKSWGRVVSKQHQTTTALIKWTKIHFSKESHDDLWLNGQFNIPYFSHRSFSFFSWLFWHSSATAVNFSTSYTAKEHQHVCELMHSTR